MKPYLLSIIYIGVNLILTILIIYFTIKLLLIFISLLPWYKGDCPYVPTKRFSLCKAYEFLNLEKGDKVLDMGSGDGQFLLYSARRVKAKFVGVEVNKFLLLLSRIKSFFTRSQGQVEIIEGDFNEHDLGGYNKIFMFSMPSLLEKLMPKLEKEIKKGALIASIKFPINSEYFKQIHKAEKKGVPEVYAYKKIK